MKKNTTILVVISALAVIGSIGWIARQSVDVIAIHHGANMTENRKRPAMDPVHGIVLEITKRLDLNVEQQKSATEIIESAQPHMAAIRNDKSLSQEERQKKMGQAMSEMIPKVQAILSPAQKEKFTQLVAEMHGGHGAMPH